MSNVDCIPGGVDYGMEDVSGSIPAGQTEAVVSLPIVNDNVPEQIRENFAVVLRDISLDGLIFGTKTIIVTILDDDRKYIIVKEPSHISFPMTEVCTLLFMISWKSISHQVSCGGFHFNPYWVLSVADVSIMAQLANLN